MKLIDMGADLNFQDEVVVLLVSHAVHAEGRDCAAAVIVAVTSLSLRISSKPCYSSRLDAQHLSRYAAVKSVRWVMRMRM